MYELTFRLDGTAELTDPDDDDAVVWASDSDEDFRDDFPDEALSEADLEKVIDWLVDHEVIDEDEAASLEAFSDDGGIGPGDDDDDGGDDEADDWGDDEGETFDAA